MKRYAIKVLAVIGIVFATFYLARLAYLQAWEHSRIRDVASGAGVRTYDAIHDVASVTGVRTHDDIHDVALDTGVRTHDDIHDVALDTGVRTRDDIHDVALDTGVRTHDDIHDVASDTGVRTHGKWTYVRGRRTPSTEATYANQTCQEKRQFVFIKCMKCATETMGTMLRRYGLRKNLSFVIPSGELMYLGWPYKMTHNDYRKNKTPQFDALMEHSIYDREFMNWIMPPETAYITMVREPYSHFLSVFYYFNIVSIAKVPTPEPITEYLKFVYRYDATYRSHESAPLRYCVPDNFSITRNLQSHCIGMPLGFQNASVNITHDHAAIQAYIKMLEHEFTLVMLVEYFMESLVLLKRLMCWTSRDVIHKSININNYSAKTQPNSQANVDIYKQWSNVDYILYDHFYKVFWRKVREQTADFFDEVKQFRQTQDRVMYYCYKSKDQSDLVIPETMWDAEFHFTRKECDMMDIYLLDTIKERYDNMPSV